MQIHILSRNLIKPSSPTPRDRKNLKLSFIDELSPPVYPTMIYYYPANSSKCRAKNVDRRHQLEKSLSDTLTLFYPLAGRFIKDKLLVDCNDQGVEYLEAQVDGQLSEILQGEPNTELLNHLAPFVAESDTSPLVAIQINVFDCGGLVIGVRVSHRVADGFSLFGFIREWATVSRVGINEAIRPSFDAASLLPVGDISWVKPQTTKNKGAKFVTRRFIFDGTAISSLKAKAKAKASRVDVVMACIWRALICIAQAKNGHLRPSLLNHPMNLRGKMFSPLLENCFGNLYRRCMVRFMGDENEMEFHDLVSLLQDAKRNAITECEKTLKDGDYGLMSVINSFKELHEELYNDEVDLHPMSSVCNFPIYEADFGWGKPSWVSRVSVPLELVVLMDTKYGNGIEAWVSLEEKDMLQFQQDPNIVAYISLSHPTIDNRQSSYNALRSSL
ncbi:hypothetical protein L1049_014637 [Liquidambar formosana]|uniref:Uncharacterized protein n=1 Tax=Liquidambar formosana TaxID=63359 RepID=A0AAP0S3K9_LIQFO